MKQNYVQLLASKLIKLASETYRFSKDRMQLFLATILSHGPVCSSTISRWLNKKLQEENLGTAASMAAALTRVSTQEIMNREGWTRENTFCQFYYKPSEKIASLQRFTKGVLAQAKDMLIEPQPSKYT